MPSWLPVALDSGNKDVVSISFSERQRRRRAGALVEDESEPVLPFSTHNIKDKVTFSERQRRRKQGEILGQGQGIRHRMKDKVTFSEQQRARKRERQKGATCSMRDAVNDAGFAGGVLDSPDTPLSPSAAWDAQVLPEPEEEAEEAASTIEEGTASMVSGQSNLQRFRIRLKGGPMMKRLISGAFAGTISRTVVAPLETIRTHLMVGSMKGQSVPGAFTHILHTEGWRGLFRGNGINVLRVAPSKAVELFMFDTMKKHLTPREGEKPLLPFPTAPVAGAIAGISSTICTYPLELLKTRLTVQSGIYKSIPDAVVRIVREEGARELYRGLVPSVIGVAPYAGANYYAYDTLKTLHKKITKQPHPQPLETLVIGSLAGAFASTLTFPLEVARKQMQVGALKGRVVYTSTMHAITSILKEQGVRGLYVGLGPSCIKLMPAAGISFMCYEVFKRALLDDAQAQEDAKAKCSVQQPQSEEKTSA